jgi:putative ABC transport system permease protein
MFRIKDIHYALRHIFRYKEYLLLNVVGLALGMASAILIMLWVEHEVKTDKFHANGENIYRIMTIFKFSDEDISIDESVTGPLAPAIEEEVPEVKYAVRVSWKEEVLFRLGDMMFYEEGHFADSSFFKVFSFPFLQGNSATALNNPNSVVISEKLAKKYFGNENAVGNTIRIRSDKEELYTITGVFKDIPSYSSLQFDYILPFAKYIEYNSAFIHWGNFNMMTFMLAEPKSPIAVLDKKITDTYLEHATWKIPTFCVQLFEEAYLHNEYGTSKFNPSGLIVYVRIFSLVALFIVFLACMNYTNLSTAIATRRGREVGVKKVFGSGRRFIFRQFTMEAVTLTVIGFLLAILIIIGVIPYFNRLINSNLTFDLHNYHVILIALGVPILTGILAGAFPAIYMSSFKPIAVLKTSSNSNKGIPLLRKSLVIFQFVITIVFIISSILIFKQIKYIQNKSLGLNEDNVVFFPQSLLIMKHRDAFRHELEQQPGVLSVTYTNMSPLEVNNNTTDPTWRGKPADLIIGIPNMSVDYSFCKTFDVDIIYGRDFNSANPSDTNALLINEKFADIIGLDDPVGEIINYWGRRAPIIGVVKDFHIGSMHRPIEQLMIMNRPGETWLTMVRINGKMRKEALTNIENAFRSFDESVPFEYQFVDEEYAKNYDDEKYLSHLAFLFTILTIIISCLGLFGLALFTAEQRTKEIGIRKSIGAKTNQVMALLTEQFLSWVIISYILASCIAWYGMKIWLEDFAYHTEISWWVFIATGLLTFLIAIITVSWQAYRAANRNPVESLRYE